MSFEATAFRLPVVHLIEGPVGAGKSTFARTLAKEQRAVWFNLDDWYARLYRQDRPAEGVMPWYAERKQRCHEQILRVTLALLDVGSDAVLELGLIRRSDRNRLYEQLEGVACDLRIYVLEAPEDVRRNRVRTRNLVQDDTFSIEIPDRIFELASRMWEAPDAAECEGRKLQWIRSA